MDLLALHPASRPLSATVRLPGSKSLSIRALTAAVLADGLSHLSGLLDAEDTHMMIDALRALSFEIAADLERSSAVVRGGGGFIPAIEADVYGANSGATVRFCTALAALGQGVYRIDGSARMRQRPIGALVDALGALGAAAEYEGAHGYPPLVIRATGLFGSAVAFDHAPSSQMVSALLLAAPCARGDVWVEVLGELPSKPYVEMTLAVMEAFGVEVLRMPDGAQEPAAAGHPTIRYIVPAPQRYRARDYSIEPDASSAAYFLAAAAVAGGRVTVTGLGAASVQGDVRFIDVLETMGCTVEQRADALSVERAAGVGLHGVDVDLGDMPDTVQTLAVVACFAEGPTRIRNVANLRFKETDRLAALATELSKLGAEVEEHTDGLTVRPPARVRAARIATHEDHRMAMSFALAGLVVKGVEIENPGCVAKSFPRFFEAWEAMQR